jgi:hypothetical protein
VRIASIDLTTPIALEMRLIEVPRTKWRFFVTKNYPEITKDILGHLKAFRQNQAGVMQVFSKNACMLLLLMNNLA